MAHGVCTGSLLTGREEAAMYTVIAVVVFGLIGAAILGVAVYIGGMLLSGPVILADETVKEIRHVREKHTHQPRAQTSNTGRMALHH
jgi:hypothetical protein